MNEILGKWQQPAGQVFAGLWFEFKADGTFVAKYEEMAIESSGTYKAENGLIDMEQTKHTLGLVGSFFGRYVVEGDTLTLNLGDPGAARPDSLDGKNRRLYVRRIES